MSGGAVEGADGRLRCSWGNSTPEYVGYHDTEWGRPLHDPRSMFERLCLEAFQSGLSWLTILRKRESFRQAFDNFSIEAVARYGPADRERLLADAGIVRNRAKVDATIANAAAALRLDEPLDRFVWSFRPPPRPAPAGNADIPASTPESVVLAKGLKKAGFVFVGPTTAYATMQAAGLVNDHLADCWVRAEVDALTAA